MCTIREASREALDPASNEKGRRFAHSSSKENAQVHVNRDSTDSKLFGSGVESADAQSLRSFEAGSEGCEEPMTTMAAPPMSVEEIEAYVKNEMGRIRDAWSERVKEECSKNTKLKREILKLREELKEKTVDKALQDRLQRDVRLGREQAAKARELSNELEKLRKQHMRTASELTLWREAASDFFNAHSAHFTRGDSTHPLNQGDPSEAAAVAGAGACTRTGDVGEEAVGGAVDDKGRGTTSAPSTPTQDMARLGVPSESVDLQMRLFDMLAETQVALKRAEAVEEEKRALEMELDEARREAQTEKDLAVRYRAKTVSQENKQKGLRFENEKLKQQIGVLRRSLVSAGVPVAESVAASSAMTSSSASSREASPNNPTDRQSFHSEWSTEQYRERYTERFTEEERRASLRSAEELEQAKKAMEEQERQMNALQTELERWKAKEKDFVTQAKRSEDLVKDLKSAELFKNCLLTQIQVLHTKIGKLHEIIASFQKKGQAPEGDDEAAVGGKRGPVSGGQAGGLPCLTPPGDIFGPEGQQTMWADSRGSQSVSHLRSGNEKRESRLKLEGLARLELLLVMVDKCLGWKIEFSGLITSRTTSIIASSSLTSAETPGTVRFSLSTRQLLPFFKSKNVRSFLQQAIDSAATPPTPANLGEGGLGFGNGAGSRLGEGADSSTPFTGKGAGPGVAGEPDVEVQFTGRYFSFWKHEKQWQEQFKARQNLAAFAAFVTLFEHHGRQRRNGWPQPTAGEPAAKLLRISAEEKEGGTDVEDTLGGNDEEQI